MSANVTQNINKLIPYNKYCIDSAKYYVDTELFTQINIPSNFILIDSDTGEQLNNFKRSSLEIPYKNHKIYIATVKKQLKQTCINKILIYYSSKIAGNQYFNGNTKELYIEVLEYIKSLGYLSFELAENIFNGTYVKDLDMKMDMKLRIKDKNEITEYNKQLKDRFNGNASDIAVFNNNARGFGLMANNRATATITKPFLKFYDKSLELITKNADFTNTLSEYIRNEIDFNFIYRYEFTMKNKSFFTKFGLTNKLSELLLVSNEKWIEIGKYFLNANFQVIIKKPRDTSKLRPMEKVLCTYFMQDINNGMNITEIKNKYVTSQSDRKSRYRMGEVFERVYYYCTVGNVKEITDKYEIVTKWDKYFGII